MQVISKFNKGILFLLCVTDIFCRYAWEIPLKEKIETKIINAFQIKIKWNESNRKPNNIWVDKGSDFYKTKKENLSLLKDL